MEAQGQATKLIRQRLTSGTGKSEGSKNVFKSWIECSTCGGEVKIAYVFCPHCGIEFARDI